MAAPPAAAAAAGVLAVAKGATLGFKALPTASLPAEAPAPTPADAADWAGIYPQLSFAQALAYLPNQFERGCASASVVRLVAKRDIVLVAIANPVFADGTVSSAAKAQLVREAVHALAASGDHPEVAMPLRDDLPLLRACGECCIALCVPDAEGPELVLPKSMFTQEWLECEPLFTFVESASVSATVGEVVGQRLHRSVLMDWALLTETLEKQLDETRCAALELAVEQAARGGGSGDGRLA